MKSGNHKNSSTARGAAAQRCKPSARPGKGRRASRVEKPWCEGRCAREKRIGHFRRHEAEPQGRKSLDGRRFGKNNLDRLGKPGKPGGPSDASRPNKPNRSNKSGKASKSGKSTKFAKAAPVRRNGGLRAAVLEGALRQGRFSVPSIANAAVANGLPCLMPNS